MYKCYTEARSPNHCCRGKSVRVKYYECVSIVSVVSVTRHAECIRRTMLLSVASLALPQFSTLSHKRHVFREKKSYWT
jgi:hypothetical protein